MPEIFQYNHNLVQCWDARINNIPNPLNFVNLQKTRKHEIKWLANINGFTVLFRFSISIAIFIGFKD